VLCRICGSARVAAVGEVEYYFGYKFEVYDCEDCFCRFTQHLSSVYESLHANARSCYGLQLEMARKSKKLFDQRDLAGLKEELCCSSKNKFVIESIDPYPRSARLLEVGCSRGYLTSYFILSGFDVVGTDVSALVLDAAVADFGPFFFNANSRDIADRSPYDVIFHIGTIGCVSDPVAMTRSLLGMLKPGGRLLFNAPNALACWLRGQLWIDFAPPPDVVTLYTPGFWARFFSDEAYVTEEVEDCPADYSLLIWLRKFTQAWRTPRVGSLSDSLEYYKHGPTPLSSPFTRMRSIVERGALRLSSGVGITSLVPRQPAPYGLFVTLTKK
jgi:2-polyprenyl-3-methyl-5-hydroxy-6-metoxy-1,4-benzoquinol methylase